MTIFHICQKYNEKMKCNFDSKQLILACLRVSAVIHDVEIRQEYYIEQYYNSVLRDDQLRASDNLQSPTSNGTTISGSNCNQNKFIPLDKIKKKLTGEFIQT